MKPLFPFLLPLFSCAAASAASVAYTFESSNNSATTTGTGFSVGALTENGNSATSPNNPLSTGAVYGRLTTTSDSVATPADTTVVRAFVPANVSNNSAPPINSHTTYLQFTITPAAGQTLDLSSALFSFTLGAITGNSPNQDMPAYATMGYAINSSTTFTQLGSTVSATAPAYNTATPNWQATTGFNTTTARFDLVQNSATSVSLAPIGTLNAGDSVTFRIAVGDNSTVNTALNATTSMKSLYVDDIAITGFNVIPEPCSALLSFAGLGLAALRRRR